MCIHFEYELTTKQSIFLWLYQVLPNIDIIHHIYNYKESLEYKDTLIYYGFLSNNIIVSGTPLYMNHPIKINALLIKLIMKPGFICTFIFNEEDYESIELTEINNGNWISVIPYINESPSLKDKLTCIHSILENEPYFIETIGQRLDKYVKLYETNSIVRLGIDQNNNYYLPLF